MKITNTQLGICLVAATLSVAVATTGCSKSEEKPQGKPAPVINKNLITESEAMKFALNEPIDEVTVKSEDMIGIDTIDPISGLGLNTPEVKTEDSNLKTEVNETRREESQVAKAFTSLVKGLNRNQTMPVVYYLWHRSWQDVRDGGIESTSNLDSAVYVVSYLTMLKSKYGSFDDVSMAAIDKTIDKNPMTVIAQSLKAHDGKFKEVEASLKGLEGRVSKIEGHLTLLEQGLQQEIEARKAAIEAEQKAREAAILAEATARAKAIVEAVTKEAEARAKAVTDEAKARSDADKLEAETRAQKDRELADKLAKEEQDRRRGDDEKMIQILDRDLSAKAVKVSEAYRSAGHATQSRKSNVHASSAGELTQREKKAKLNYELVKAEFDALCKERNDIASRWGFQTKSFENFVK